MTVVTLQELINIKDYNSMQSCDNLYYYFQIWKRLQIKTQRFCLDLVSYKGSNIVTIHRGVFRNLSRGSLNLFSFHVGGGAQHPLGHENPLKSIDFTGPGGA